MTVMGVIVAVVAAVTGDNGSSRHTSEPAEANMVVRAAVTAKVVAAVATRVETVVVTGISLMVLPESLQWHELAGMTSSLRTTRSKGRSAALIHKAALTVKSITLFSSHHGLRGWQCQLSPSDSNSLNSGYLSDHSHIDRTPGLKSFGCGASREEQRVVDGTLC